MSLVSIVLTGGPSNMPDLMLDNLTEGFRSLGLKDGDTLVVHSSLKSLGYVHGGAKTVIEALLEVIGQAGTLVVPTLTGKREDSPNCPPVFDVLKTPCWTGIIPETVRSMAGAVRSLHPTHSVAVLGSKKYAITSGHEDSQSPCDAKSPFFKNAATGGYILLIGVDQESNTSIHSCEEIAEVPYHLQQDLTRIYITGYEEKRVFVINRLHDWGKPATDFNKLDDLYQSHGIMKVGKIGAAEVRLLKAAAMFDFTIDLLKKDPMFLLV